MSKKIDRAGKKYERLIVLFDAGRDKWGNVIWQCECDCGNILPVLGYHLQASHSRSCGCLRKEETGKRTASHRLSHHPLCTVWHNMKNRCYNPKNKKYKWYGGKGIEIYPSWRSDFLIFFNWAITHGYKAGLTIDRINSDGSYCPNNCQFITIAKNILKQQGLRSNNKTGFKGVSWRKDTQKYQASICVNGNQKNLGSFDSLIEAVKVYDQAAFNVGDGRILNSDIRKMGGYR